MTPTNVELLARLGRRWGALLLGAVLVATLGGLGWGWHTRNGLMNGYQNEFLHVGNALDLWDAWHRGDRWTLGVLLTTNYWPPLFYLAPWPLFAAMGAGHDAMVASNLGWLALLLWGVYLLGSRLGGPSAGAWSMAVVALWPSVVGNLVRYEPSVAVAALVTLATVALLDADLGSRRAASLAFAALCAACLLLDRLSGALFLAWPALAAVTAAALRPDRGPRLYNGLLGLALVLAFTGWWHWNFLQLHLEEILTQQAGEIDATGVRTELRDRAAASTWLFYLSVLIDAQAGPVAGVVALAATAVGARRWLQDKTSPHWAPLLVVLGGWAVLTLILKKQVYYSIPLLGCLAALTGDLLARLPRPAALALGAVLLTTGVHQVGVGAWGRGLNLPPSLSWLAGPVLPDTWVDRGLYPQLTTPAWAWQDLDGLAAALPPGDVVVYSTDALLFESYLVLGLRERLPDRRVRGLSTDPQGSYERFRLSGSLVVVHPAGRGGWPQRPGLQEAIRLQNHGMSQLPPVAEVVAESEGAFRLAATWPAPEGARIELWRRRPAHAGDGT